MMPRFMTCGHQESGDGVVADGRGTDRAQDAGLMEEDGSPYPMPQTPPELRWCCSQEDFLEEVASEKADKRTFLL